MCWLKNCLKINPFLLILILNFLREAAMYVNIILLIFITQNKRHYDFCTTKKINVKAHT